MHVCVLTLYIILVFFVYNEGSSKTHQSSLTLKGGSTAHLGLLPSGKKRKPLLLVALNHFILWLADHQRSTPAAELRFFVRDEPHRHTIQDVCCLLDAEGMLARRMLLAGIAV